MNSRISSTVSVIIPSGFKVNGIFNSSPTVNSSSSSRAFWSSSEITTPSTWCSVTNTSYVASFPATVNLIVATPSLTAVTTPFSSTVAISGFKDSHFLVVSSVDLWTVSSSTSVV